MQYYFSLGSNLGEREQTIQHAIKMIEQQIGHVLRCSSFYYSEPWGFSSPHPFCNVCCLLETDLQPLEVLHATQVIERQLGRIQKSESINNKSAIYSDRSIDIDIICVFADGKELIFDTPELHIPHRLWHERDFVKIPLKEIEE